ncbi:hypothetical protein [Vibrio rumoiensis]|uniref:hypothetical protein n=1 Tax=Vibrio rumoiensis TaxID=76258 RepID=UPI00030C892B|nr:hypothetical protein [Vibrio rumoiensis]
MAIFNTEFIGALPVWTSEHITSPKQTAIKPFKLLWYVAEKEQLACQRCSL